MLWLNSSTMTAVGTVVETAVETAVETITIAITGSNELDTSTKASTNDAAAQNPGNTGLDGSATVSTEEPATPIVNNAGLDSSFMASTEDTAASITGNTMLDVSTTASIETANPSQQGNTRLNGSAIGSTDDAAYPTVVETGLDNSTMTFKDSTATPIPESRLDTPTMTSTEATFIPVTDKAALDNSTMASKWMAPEPISEKAELNGVPTRSTRIATLAALIKENTDKVNNYLAEHNLPPPSFDVNGPSKSMIPPEAKDIEAARVAVIDATLELRNFMLGPSDYMITVQVRPKPITILQAQKLKPKAAQRTPQPPSNHPIQTRDQLPHRLRNNLRPNRQDKRTARGRRPPVDTPRHYEIHLQGTAQGRCCPQRCIETPRYRSSHLRLGESLRGRAVAIGFADCPRHDHVSWFAGAE